MVSEKGKSELPEVLEDALEAISDTKPDAPAPSEAPASRDRETQDDILDRILGPITDGSGPEKAKKPAAPKEAAAETKNTVEDSDDSAAVDEVVGDEETRPAVDLEPALKALRQAGFSTSDLEGMSDEAIQTLGAKQAKMQKDQQEYVRKLTADLKAAKESAPAQSETDSAGESAELASEETVATLKERMKPLAEDFGWEANHVDAFTGLVGDVVAKANETLLAELAATKEKLERANEAAHQALFDNARGRLGERIPRLRDDVAFKEKVEPALRKLDVASYDTVDDILIDAARMAGFRIYKNREEAESSAQELSRAKSNGKPDTVGNRATAVSTKGMTPDEKMEAILIHLQNGGTQAEWEAANR